MAATKNRIILCIVLINVFWNINGQPEKCKQEKNCKLPNCFCSTFQHPFFNSSDIPQMVYFGFDDALTPLVDPIYKKLFRQDRRNPNGCPVGITLFVSNQYTSYAEVGFFHNRGMEIASHSVHHGHTKTEKYLYAEAKQQKENLARRGGFPASEITGWRSPFLETAGDYQPEVLHKLGYDYDISLTYRRGKMRDPNPWPFTADYGWPFNCQMKPCLSYSHPGFWEFPVNTMFDFKGEYPCNYVDGCYNRPTNENEAYKYLMENFKNAYEGNRAPLGMNMHAAWLLTKFNFKAMDKFIHDILKMHDVFIIPVKSVLEWMKSPTRLSDINTFDAWKCGHDLKPGKVTRQQLPKTRAYITGRPTTKTYITKRPTTKSSVPSTTRRQTTIRTTESRTTVIPFKTESTTPKIIERTNANLPQHFNIPTYVAPQKPHVELETTHNRETISTDSSSLYKAKYQNKTLDIANENNSNRIQGAIRIQPTTSVETLYRPTTKHSYIKPATSSATTNNFNWSWVFGNIFRQKPSMMNSGGLTSVETKDKCVQGINCKLPDCFCEGNTIPGLLKSDIPQFVYISFDGDINSRVFSKYRNLFSGKRKNPNMCPISSTFFVSQKRSMEGYLSYLHKKGHEIALKGSSSTHVTNINQLNRDVFAQRGAMSRIGIPAYGWRSPGLKPLGDEQFSALVKQGMEYDASLVLSDSADGNAWPFTLDYGWTYQCVIPSCPKNKYPGLWEIPNIPIIDYRNLYPCNYADGCMFSPRTAEETYKFLWDNFERFYQSNKAPFGLNLRQIWFTHVAYRNNVRGFEMFLDKLGKMRDVYVVSTNKLIQWIRQPIALSEMSKFKC